MNTYLHNTLASPHDQLIQRAITQLVLMKGQQTQLDQQTGQQLYTLIHNSFNHNQEQAPPQDQDFIES
jgi:hypothetical protein